MRKYDFDTLVIRSGLGSLKDIVTGKELKEAGLNTLFGAEFDFRTAPSVIRAIKALADNGLFGYTLQDDAFNALIVGWMKTQRYWDIQKEWIVPAYGTMSALGIAIRAFTNPGDGVIVMLPGYHMYWPEILNNGRVKVDVPLLFDGFRYTVNFQMLENRMQKARNRMLVICNPHNPVGRVWTCGELAEIASLAARHDITIFSDEIFAEVVYPGFRLLSMGQASAAAVRCVTTTSLGKSFGFTGIGQANMIIPDKSTRDAFLQQRNISHYGSMDPIMRAAYFGAYCAEGSEWLDEMIAYCYENYQFVDTFFRTRLPQFQVVKPEGTYVLWVDCHGLRLSKSMQRELFFRARFGIDPGTDYGGTYHFFRMNISVPRAALEKILLSLESVVKGGKGSK